MVESDTHQPFPFAPKPTFPVRLRIHDPAPILPRLPRTSTAALESQFPAPRYSIAAPAYNYSAARYQSAQVWEAFRPASSGTRTNVPDRTAAESTQNARRLRSSRKTASVHHPDRRRPDSPPRQSQNSSARQEFSPPSPFPGSSGSKFSP